MPGLDSGTNGHSLSTCNYTFTTAVAACVIMTILRSRYCAVGLLLLLLTDAVGAPHIGDVAAIKLLRLAGCVHVTRIKPIILSTSCMCDCVWSGLLASLLARWSICDHIYSRRPIYLCVWRCGSAITCYHTLAGCILHANSLLPGTESTATSSAGPVAELSQITVCLFCSFSSYVRKKLQKQQQR